MRRMQLLKKKLMIKVEVARPIDEEIVQGTEIAIEEVIGTGTEIEKKIMIVIVIVIEEAIGIETEIGTEIEEEVIERGQEGLVPEIAAIEIEAAKKKEREDRLKMIQRFKRSAN